MIISRTPLRVTLGGGGTDDPRYVAEHGGFVVTTAICQHIYVGINDTFSHGYSLKYSEIEHATTVDDIRHPVIREAIRFYNIPPRVEIVSMADIPAGTGLGSSAAFTVGLCCALESYTGGKPTQEDLADTAAHIELDILGRPGGKQDHWATACGGPISLTLTPYGTTVNCLQTMNVQNDILLESHLSLFFTGQSRDADHILSTQSTTGLDEIKSLGYSAEKLLIAGDMVEFGQLMNEHWRLKRLRSPEMSGAFIDACYDAALQNGAIGGKIVGAGGGGFLLFVTKDRKRLSQAMAENGLQEIPFKIDYAGTSIITKSQ